MVVVVDEHGGRGRPLAAHQRLGREHRQGRIGGHRREHGARDRVGTPMRTRGQQHVREAKTEDVVCVQRAVAVHAHPRHARDLALAVVDHAAPGRQSGQPPFAHQASTQLDPAFGQHHLVAAPPQHHGRLESGRTGAHHQDALVGMAPPDALRVPAAAPFLAHRRVLGTADDGRCMVARHADIAADALADVLDPALVDLARQEGIGDGRARRADEVEHTLAHHAHHGVGRGEAAHAHHGPGRECLDAAHERFLVGLVGKARCLAVVVPPGKRQVPQVGQLGHLADDVTHLGRVQALGADHLVHRDAAGHGAAVAHRVLHVTDELAQQPGAVLQAAAVFVGARVVAARKEEHRAAEELAGVDVHDVVVGAPRA